MADSKVKQRHQLLVKLWKEGDEKQMVSEGLYHKYIFNTDRQLFIGKFEEMYQQEDIEGFDSWFQEDLTCLEKRVSITILEGYNFNRVIDLGCGKGAFTSLLKRGNNYVEGVDISPTAIRKAQVKHPLVDFNVGNIEELNFARNGTDLIVIMEVLSYLENWRGVLHAISKSTRYLYLSLYLPENPIGSVKSFRELKDAVSRDFVIKVEARPKSDIICLLGKSKDRTGKKLSQRGRRE